MNKNLLYNDGRNNPDIVNNKLNKGNKKDRINEDQQRQIKEKAMSIVQSGEINETALINKIQEELSFSKGKESSIRNYLKKLENDKEIHSIKRGKLKCWRPGNKTESIESDLIINYYKQLFKKIADITNYSNFTPSGEYYVSLIGEIKSLEKQDRIRFHRPWVMWARNVESYSYADDVEKIEIRTMEKTLDFELKNLKGSYYVSIDEIDGFDIRNLMEMDIEEMTELNFFRHNKKHNLLLEFIGYAQRYLSNKIEGE